MNPTERTATVNQVFADPDGKPSGCTGSFTPLEQGKYWVAGWGCSSSGITIFDAQTSPIVSTQLNQSAESTLTLTDPNFEKLRWALSYRVVVE